jgi:DNA-binding CsgD family transcriptional regulator
MLLQVLDAIPDVLVVWSPGAARIELANRGAREHAFLTAAEELAGDAQSCAAEQRELRRQLAAHGCSAPAQRLDRQGEVWWIRTVGLPKGLELVLGRRERLRERELVRQLRAAYALTDRQADVLRHVLRGRANPEIAAALGIAYRTVRRHLQDLQAALGVPSRVGIFQLVERLR